MSRSCWAGAVERRVGRRTGKEWLLLFAFRTWLLNIRRNTRERYCGPTPFLELASFIVKNFAYDKR